MKAFKILSLLSVATIYVLIVIGGLVTGTGSGLSGGTEWPIPREGLLPTPESFLEYIHRAWTAVVGIMIIGTTISGWMSRKDSGQIAAIFATVPFALVLVQIPMGMVVLQTGLSAIAVAAHNSLAAAIFGAALATAVLAFSSRKNKDGNFLR